MRTFLAKNGMMNNALTELGILIPCRPTSFLDWRGIVITFVWKQTPFVALLVAGAMASLDRVHDRSGAQPRRLAAAHPVEIVLPQVADTAGRPDPDFRDHDVGACRCR